MNALGAVVIVAILGFVFVWKDPRYFAYRQRKKQESNAINTDPRVLACLVEQQAKLDLLMTSTRALLRTHPNASDVAVVLRAAATHLTATSARETPETHATYERALRATLETLVGD
ncbi:hypothetical protein [Paraburkholderia caballeronis]|uniref:hypothetical protein n=1 Tax=Paraburkholderia caballeronis TaxID=416943 RepID=UPI0010648B14|nr:hypothetical protein [Paraburkholderia caballeronis]TDV06039.1 hypothetical protein C7408_12420 [Paraburkholderia caballeronis]TDV09579.1 hypothetical protein C7406_12620 [Paraburkholderia caballeronis]TDV21644.1 hypothetical protein C7404_12120 [Paraburkholderia caballeronis]